jgi:chorismate mutase/prephenate dehydratase
MKNKPDHLHRFRKQIDNIDSKILDLINQRLEIGKKVGRIKAESGTGVLDREREKNILENLSRMNKGPADDELLRYFFNVIITATREIQKPAYISFSGPRAGYAHVAALNHFKHSGKFISRPAIYEVFRDVEKGRARFGVIPVENSIEGAVTHTLDLFADFDVTICAEHYEPVCRDLLSRTGKSCDIRTICGHPQALDQCKYFIEKNFADAKIIETPTSSKAVIMASEDSTIAAVAHRQAAHIYGLQIVETKIEDYSGNITRFLVIGNEMPEPTGKDKTSVMFETSHVPGALFKALRPIDSAGLNMLKLESRPTRHHNWSYYFFMDIEGHINDRIMSDTIDKIRELSLFLKVLGSYPVFGEVKSGS